MARLMAVMARLARTKARPARAHGAIPSQSPPPQKYLLCLLKQSDVSSWKYRYSV
jgi:hypothetical protein